MHAAERLASYAQCRILCADLLQATLTENLTADALENRIWPPDAVRRLYLWWCQEVDTLLAANPLWRAPTQYELSFSKLKITLTGTKHWH